MIFISRKRFEEEANRRVIQEQERIRTDQRMYEMEEAISKLRWRVEALESERRHDVPVCTTCKEGK